jgi:hypothetical protein
MDSKTVSKEIRHTIHPLLKEVGFSVFTSRSGWRFLNHRIDVVNFQSFNSYHASVMDCTTYSFAVNLGVYPLVIPYDLGEDRMTRKKDRILPQEYQCPFRKHLNRSIPQPESRFPELWYVDPAGRYLPKVLHDVRRVLLRDGIPWFGRLTDTQQIFRIFVDEPASLGCGAHSSPIRSYLTGYLAKSLGNLALARDELQKALDSGCFQFVERRLAKDIKACGLGSR